MVNIEPVKALDAELSQLVKPIEILRVITPLNYGEQRQAFFDSNYRDNPQFEYVDNSLNTFRFKRQLYSLPLETIRDKTLHYLYEEVIASYADKVDQFTSVGSPEFLYNCLRYYGEPSDKDMGNAEFLLHLAPEPVVPAEIDADGIVAALHKMAKRQGYQCRIELHDNMIANAQVDGTRIKVNKAARCNEVEVQALAHHELGVHLVTSLNGAQQPIKLLSMGLPLNTCSQEGLAILCEYLSGNLSIKRLRTLALRVVAIRSMLQERSFRHTFLMLLEEYGVEAQQAFTLTARVYRGGGFTKDYLYLRGLREVLQAYQSAENFNHLLAGKMALPYLSEVSHLIEKGVLLEPAYISPALQRPVAPDPVLEFVMNSLS